MKFSIIVPVYNVEKYIEKCLESILNQSYDNYEVIIVNDGTKDNSQLIIDKFVKKDSRFKSYVKNNGGLSDARNFGISKACGDYLLFIDSDDYIEKDLLKLLNNTILDNLPDIVRYNLNVVDNNYNLMSKNDDISLFGNLKNNILRNKFVEPAWLYAYEINFFRENKFKFPKGKIHEDFYLTLLILDKAKKIDILNYNGYNYVQRENSIMNNNDYSKIKKRVYDFIEHNKFHKENIKNKYILSYSNKSLLFKIRELKGKDYEKEVRKINLHINEFKLKSLSFREFIYNCYLKRNYSRIIDKKNKEFYKGENYES